MPQHNDSTVSESIRSGVMTLAKVLRGDGARNGDEGKFIIPFYQRPYAWQPESVTMMLEDIEDGIAQDKEHHFLGTIMLTPGMDGRKEINDGQQRITTFMLILAHLCKFFDDNNQDLEVNECMRILFVLAEGHRADYSDAQQQDPRVKLAQNDSHVFETLICGNTVGAGNGPVMSAWGAIAAFFNAPGYQSVSSRQEVLAFLMNRLLVAYIEFGEGVDAIAVFETLNTRGQSLEQIQIAITFLFSCLRRDANNVRRERMQEQINMIRTYFKSDERRFFEYARCFIQCIYGHLSAKNFCKDLRRAMHEHDGNGNFADASVKIVERMSQTDMMQIFQNVMIKNGEEFLGQIDRLSRRQGNRRKMGDYLRDVRPYTVYQPILFALLHKFNEARNSDVAKFVHASCRLLASFAQRAGHSFAGSFRPSEYEQDVAKLAMQIYGGRCSTVQGMLDGLRQLDQRDHIIPDAQYKERMRNISYGRDTKKAKYILARLNEDMSGSDGSRVDESRSTLEHILPQSPRHLGEWQFDGDEHKLYKNRLGNLTLLAPTDASSTDEGNASYAAKRPSFEQSAYAITKDVAQMYEHWDKDHIEQRQHRLAKQAAQLWNFRL